MLLVLTSPDVIAPSGSPDQTLVDVLIETKQAGNPTGVVSNQPEPKWFNASFGTGVQHVRENSRQTGDVIERNAKKFGLNGYDTVVLAGKREDIQMGKNGGAVLIAAGWSSDSYVKSLGIQVNDAPELREVLHLTSDWNGTWWYEGTESWYSVKALSDLSSYNKGWSQEEFAGRVTAVVKNGGPRLMALLTVAARSLLKSGYGSTKELMWGVYPSSGSSNDDTDVLSEFTHRVRTTVSNVRLAKRDAPLFIRHSPSAKRSKGGGGDRTDPSQQIETLHLNPEYRKQVKDRNVMVIDDCTTYGVSFGVAAAFLRKAGASSVTGVALGKFGRQLRYYEIDINGDPFAPVLPSQYAIRVNRIFNGVESLVSQNELKALIK